VIPVRVRSELLLWGVFLCSYAAGASLKFLIRNSTSPTKENPDELAP
jgi:hypothetical protein